MKIEKIGVQDLTVSLTKIAVSVGGDSKFSAVGHTGDFVLSSATPSKVFTIKFTPVTVGHHSALLKISSTSVVQTPSHIVMHGYAKGTGAPGVLGTANPISFLNDTDFYNS